MPWGSARKLPSQAAFAVPHASISFPLSAPPITAQRAIVRMLAKGCSFVRSRSGSSTAAKCVHRLSPSRRVIPILGV
jgi:hypothetical protein